MPATTKFTAASKGIPQHGTNWCIPASIENLLRSEGIIDITQEDLLYEHILSLNLSGTTNAGGNVALNSLQRHQVIEMFRCPPIPNATFQSFGPITNSILNRNGISLKLTDIPGIKTQADYVKHLNALLSQDKPVLMSAGHASGWHITIVYQIDPTDLWSYDPGQDKHLVEPISSYKFSHDVLYVH